MADVTISFKTNKLTGELRLTSKVTILRGDSGIGKSTIISVFNSESAVIHVSSGYRLVDLPQMRRLYSTMTKEYYLDLFNVISGGYDRVIFYGDEDLDYMRTREFQEAVNEYNGLFFIVGRVNFGSVPYSVWDIKRLVSRKYGSGRAKYWLEDFYEKFNHVDLQIISRAVCVMLEDSKSGRELFESTGARIVPASGKDQVVLNMKDSVYSNTLFIADGLGFGSSIESAVDKLKRNNTIGLYLIDSFESMILHSNFISEFVKVQEPDITVSNKEEFYTQQLGTVMQTSGIDGGEKYSKSKLHRCLIDDCCTRRGRPCKFYVKGDKARLLIPETLYNYLITIAMNAYLEDDDKSVFE